MTPGPYARAACAYHAAGWSPLPLPARAKANPPTGYTGATGRYPTSSDIDGWVRTHGDGNVAIRMPAGVIGVDVDHYATKQGGDRLDQLCADLDVTLPATWVSTARPAPSGIRWFRITDGIRLRGAPLAGVEIVQAHHRYAVAPPSIHPDTDDAYRWITPAGELATRCPTVHELPALPDELIAAWRDDTPPATARAPQPPAPPPGGVDRSHAVDRILDERSPWTAGCRHDEACRLSMALARLEHSGHPGATDALNLVGADFVAAVAGERDGEREWAALLSSARATAAGTAATRPTYADAVADHQAHAATAATATSNRLESELALPPFTTPGQPAVDTGLLSPPLEQPAAPVEPAPLTSWEPIDLAAVLDGADTPKPVIWAHAAGHCMLYAGRTHTFAGASESCKSWAAQAAVAETIAAAGAVLYIDYEDDERGVVSRLRALGATSTAIARHIAYVRPDEPLIDRSGRHTPAELRFVTLVHEQPWQLVVLDGVTEAMTTEGLEVNDNSDAARFARRIMRPLADAGAAVVGIDHQTKNGDNGRFALGAQHKLAGLTGAAYRFETQRPISRADGTEPVIGTVKVTVSKDRPGHVRAHAPEGIAGIMRLTAWPDGGMYIDLIDPAELGDASADMALIADILDHVATYEGASGRQLTDSISGKAESIRAATKHAVSRGWLEVRKEGQAHRHYLTDDGQIELDR